VCVCVLPHAPPPKRFVSIWASGGKGKGRKSARGKMILKSGLIYALANLDFIASRLAAAAARINIP